VGKMLFVCKSKINKEGDTENRRIHTQQKFNVYNDVSNQQDATTSSFIDLFKSAVHVSGDKFGHPQEHFLTVYTTFSAPYQKLCIQSKSAPEDV
jgi:hypothetical protein